MRAPTLLLVVLAGVTAAACKSDNSLGVVVPKNTGETVTVEGRVCDPERGTWLEGADVYMHLFDEDGSHYNTIWDETDASGLFQLVDVPVDGLQPVYVQYGNQVIDQFEIEVPLGMTYVVLPDPDCGGSDAAMAVVSGDYEDFEATLADLGYGDFDLVNGQTGDELVQFLSSEAAMAGYDAIIFGGGHLEEDIFYDTNGSDVDGVVSQVRAAVRAYVEGGGHIVVTDWSYDIVEAIWPDQVTFLGDDRVPDDAQVGEAGLVTANVIDEAMATAVGADQVNVNFDLIDFPVVEGVDNATTTVYLRADVTWREGESTYVQSGSPLLLSFQAGSGSVSLSTFRFSSNTETTAKTAVRALLNGL